MDEIFAIWITDNVHHYMPFLYEVCISSWHYMNPQYKVVLYTNDTRLKLNFLSKDVTEVRIIQDVLPGVLEKAQEITSNTVQGMKFPHQCDYVRYNILAKFGGIAVDCDEVCISPIEELINYMKLENKSITFGYEDDNRIAIAFLTNIDKKGTDFYNDIIEHYNNHYVKTSWLYNSIKYPMLLKNKYWQQIYELKPKFNFYYPNGLGYEDDPLCDTSVLTEPIVPDSVCGYGVHLYNSTPQWRTIRAQITDNLYTDNLNWWILEHLNKSINYYINLMCNSEYRDISQDVEMSNMLKDLYGQEYVDKFKEVKNG